MAQQILNFLDTQLGIPQRLRDAIQRMHSGKCPLWRPLSLTRGVGQIVEVAARCAQGGDKHAISVVRWYWTDRHIGLNWHDCATLEEAQAYQERTFRLEAAAPPLRS